jgi:hypothetical protein
VPVLMRLSRASPGMNEAPMLCGFSQHASRFLMSDGVIWIRKWGQLSATSGPSDHRAEESKCYITRMLTETVVGLAWAADSCPWVGKLRTVLPLTVGIRDSAVQLLLAHERWGICRRRRRWW